MSTSRVNEIDLLRFIAALLVVFFHLSFRGYAADNMTVMPYPLLAPIAKYGYLGVNLFFMISGFVILMTASSGSLQKFVVSRIARLYPAFWACCTITFVMIITIGDDRYVASLSQYFINMTMLNGFFGVPSIDGAYWSLFVEMQFYALVSAVLVVKRIHQAQILLILWLIASFFLEIAPVKILRHLLIIDWSTYFIGGATCFLIWSQGVSLKRIGIIVFSWILAMIQSINKLPSFEDHYNISMSVIVVSGFITTFYLIMLLIAIRRTGFAGRYRWVMFGVLTYPLYLIHQNVGYMIFNIAYPIVNPHLIFWITMSAIIGIAYMIHFFIEKKISLAIKKLLNTNICNIKYLLIRHRAEAPD